MRGLRRYAPILATVLAVSSCSMARFGYDALPTWVHWQAERFLDLDEDQRAIVSRRVDELHRWHRRFQLPKYVVFLHSVDDDLTTMWHSCDARRRHSIERAVEASDALAAQMIADATPKQREHLSKLLTGFATDFEKLSRRGERHDRREEARAAR